MNTSDIRLKALVLLPLLWRTGTRLYHGLCEGAHSIKVHLPLFWRAGVICSLLKGSCFSHSADCLPLEIPPRRSWVSWTSGCWGHGNTFLLKQLLPHTTSQRTKRTKKAKQQQPKIKKGREGKCAQGNVTLLRSLGVFSCKAKLAEKMGGMCLVFT